MGKLNNVKLLKAVFLDRDGVLNEPIVIDGKPYPPNNLSELIIYPGASNNLKRLRALGYLLVVVTNQPDVARGKTSLETVNSINNAIKDKLPVDLILTCFHDDNDGCNCRKPKFGMFLNAAAQLSLNLNDCYMIGDRWKDIQAGENASCKTIFVDRRYTERRPAAPDYEVSDLREAVNIIEEHTIA